MGKTKVKDKYNNANISFQGVIASFNAKKYAKSKFYRSELESFVGYNAIITGEVGKIQAMKIKKRRYNRFLLKNVCVLQARNKSVNIKVQHIWIICEKGFLSRNRIAEGDKPTLNGNFYEYRKYDRYGNPKRNIGFRLKFVCQNNNYKTESPKNCY